MRNHRALLRSAGYGLSAVLLFTFAMSGAAFAGPNQHAPGKGKPPLVLKDQGSFAFGGTVIAGEDGDTFHGDHGYAQYQIPPNARKLPLVMWHGGGQFSKTWESTPDGRDGYQNIFLRRGFSTYIIDQPRRGRAGRTTEGTTIPDGTPGEANIWNVFRLGIWTPPDPPTFFPGVQFPQDEDSIDQYFRQITPNTGPENFDAETREFQSDAVSALFDKIGPGILLTHSNSGQYGWRSAMKNENVRAIVSYEPATFAFPESEPPAPVPTDDAFVGLITAPDLVPDAAFDKLAEIPIQIIYGDNIEFDTPSPIFGVELWRVVVQRAQQFADAVNARGGDVELVFLPDVGIFGNTHFAFSDLNNLEIADLLSAYLKEKGLDTRGKPSS